MTPDRATGLADHVATARDPDLFDDLLSEAQAAAIAGNLRRVVLELAVAIEVCTKKAAIAHGMTPMQLRKSRASVPQLLCGAVGSDLRVALPAQHADINTLFNARNKVAHAGSAVFRDTSGSTIPITRELLRKWRQSALDVARALGKEV